MRIFKARIVRVRIIRGVVDAEKIKVPKLCDQGAQRLTLIGRTGRYIAVAVVTHLRHTVRQGPAQHKVRHACRCGRPASRARQCEE